MSAMVIHRWERDEPAFGWYCRVPPKPWGPSYYANAEYEALPVCLGCDRFLSDESVERCPADIAYSRLELSIVAAWEDQGAKA